MAGKLKNRETEPFITQTEVYNIAVKPIKQDSNRRKIPSVTESYNPYANAMMVYLNRVFT